ncbi:MAG: HD domain-containing protein [Thermoleophilia bacterium]
MKKSFICDISEGALVDDVFFLGDISRRVTRTGHPYLTLGLNDRSGVIGGRVWQDADVLVHSLTAESFVRVRGKAESYRNRLYIKVDGVEAVDISLIDQQHFLPGTYRDMEELTGYIRYFLTEVFDVDYSRLLESFFSDEIFMERFCRAPGDERSHHAYLGGLLEHTVSVATLCQHVAVQHPRLNSDLLLTAALLHDIGKVDEFNYRGRITLSREGELLGHVLLGQKMIEQRIMRLGGFPPEKELQLIHALVSHHGELEWGAPKRPQSAEALALHHLDNLDARVKGFYEVVDGSGEVPWGELQNLFRRPLTEPRAADR